jgi:O-antigen ligase
MIPVISKFNLEKIYQFLLLALAFLMPLTVFGGNLIIVIIVLLWLFSGNYKNKYNSILKSKFLLASIVFFCLHIVGLLWTNDLEWGVHIVHKMWYFLLLLPVLNSIVTKENISKYIASFLLAIFLTEVLSYLVWFELIPPFKNATVGNPTPFMSHISYNVILAFAIYLVLHRVIIQKNMKKVQTFLYVFFAFLMCFNMFITGGRAGHVAFFVILVILIFQFFSYSKIKALFTTFFLIPIIFFSAYSISPSFNDRVDKAIKSFTNYSQDIESNNQTSVGYRMTFAINSLAVIKSSPLIGVGTGDFPEEYKKINMINTPLMNNANNPHNMYILITAQLGILGLVSFLSIFYFQFKLALNSTNILLRNVGITLPLMFLVIMFSDSYLLGHFTTLIFIFFSSFLYKDFETS